MKPDLSVLLALLGLVLPANAADVFGPPAFVDYQGSVYESSGQPIGSTGTAPPYTAAPVNRTLWFKIYDAQTGGNLIWAEQQTVTVSLGAFSVRLGAGAQITSPATLAHGALTAAFNGMERYLEVTVGAGTPITPRLAFQSSPFSFVADHARTADAVSGAVTATGMASVGGVFSTGSSSLIPSSMSGGQLFTGGGGSPYSGRTIFGGDGSGWKYSIASKNASGTPVDRLVVSENGNVGIGVDAPATKLAVDGAIGAKGGGWGPANGFVFNGDNDTGVFALDANSVSLTKDGKGIQLNNTLVPNSTGGTILMDGNVGIGTTPAARLHVVAASGEVARFDNNSTTDTYITVGSYAAANAGAYMSWNKGAQKMTLSPHGISAMVIDNTGKVGIGNTNPPFPLTVSRTVGYEYNTNSTQPTVFDTNTPPIGNPDYFTANGTNGSTGTYTWPTSIWADGVVAGSAFFAMSDLRIKDIVNRSSSQSDLQLINQLQVTDYRLKDHIGSGTAIHKGFIAQEVRKLIPEAVTPSRNYIPDIYQPATQSVYDAAQKRLSVTLAKPHALAVGDWVRIYGDASTIETQVLAVESPTSFTVASDKTVAKSFVYGRRVEDFLTVDYDRIFTTGIGAIQELDRQLKEKDAKIQALQDESAALRRELAAKDASVEARLAALEQRQPATTPVSLQTAGSAK